jgi:hypothetical protein
MSTPEDEVVKSHPSYVERKPLVLRVTDIDFQRQVVEKLGRLETKMDMLMGREQPGRMQQAEDRINLLERSDIRRSVYDRVINAALAMAVSAAISLHDHWGLK